MDGTPLSDLAERLKQAGKNVRFATAIAITRATQSAQKAVRERMADVFTLRNKWSQGSVRITAARSDQPVIQSEIFVKDAYLADQETGGTRSLRKDEAIPLPMLYEETRATLGKAIPRGLRAGAIARSGRGFVRKAQSGKSYVFVRADGRAVPVFLLQDAELGQAESYKLDRKPFFEDTVEQTFTREIDPEYDKAFEKYVLERL